MVLLPYPSSGGRVVAVGWQKEAGNITVAECVHTCYGCRKWRGQFH